MTTKYPTSANVDCFLACGVTLGDLQPEWFTSSDHWLSAFDAAKEDLQNDGYTAAGLGWDDKWGDRGQEENDLPPHEGLQQAVQEIYGVDMDANSFGEQLQRAKDVMFGAKANSALDRNVQTVYLLWLRGFSADAVRAARLSLLLVLEPCVLSEPKSLASACLHVSNDASALQRLQPNITRHAIAMRSRLFCVADHGGDQGGIRRQGSGRTPLPS